MALIDRNITRLAGDEPTMMKSRQLGCQLQQFFEISDATIAAAAFKVTHERRPINWRKYYIISADAHRPVRIPRDLGEFRRGGADQLANQFSRSTDNITINIRTRLLPKGKCSRVITKCDSLFTEKPISLSLYLGQRIFIQKIIIADFAFDVGWSGRLCAAFGLAGLSTAALSFSCPHCHSLRSP